MAITARPRSDLFGNRLPVNMNGTLRPKLLSDRPYITVHFTGANANFADFGDSGSEIRGIEAWASSSAKQTPWEYNWPIDTEGVVWTYAGEYQAAHSAGENSLAHGVILLLGNNDVPTEAMINAFRKLRYELVRDNMVAEGHQVRQHGQMPGANTGCPGPHVKSKWDQFLVPWQQPTPPPTPTPTPDPSQYIISVDPWGTFTVSQQYQWPFSVAQLLYGDGDLWPWITNFNGIPSNLSGWPGVGGKVKVPGLPEGVTGSKETAYAGAMIRVPRDAGAAAIVGLLYPNEDYNKRNSRVPLQLARWNQGRTSFSPGEIIFLEVKP